MSEFITLCPKCRQRILGDTQYAGKRVACPLCLQEITLPEPPVQSRVAVPPASTPQQEPAQSPPLPGAGRKPGVPLLAIVFGGILLAAAGVGLWAVLGRAAPMEPGTALAAAPAAPAAPVVSAVPVASAWTSHPLATPPGAESAPVASPVPVPAPPTPSAPRVSGPLAASEDDCRALWRLDQDTGASAMDATGNGNNAVLMGEHAAWTKSAPGDMGGLHLSGSSYAQTTGPVIDTTRSFTVAAWVRMEAMDVNSCQTFVSLDGQQVSGFYLQYRAKNRSSGNRFVFSRLENDAQNLDKLSLARGNSIPVRDTWYHLAGVYDAPAGTLSLYVNGKLQETVPYHQAWPATGSLAIGRGYYGHATDFVQGTMGDVRVYASALSAGQIRILVSK